MIRNISKSILSKQRLGVNQMRLFAAEAADPSNTLKLNFFVPSESIIAGKEVTQVTVPGSEGMFGILPKHVPTVSELKPGLVTVDMDGKTSKYFVSGGFAFVHDNSVADIAASEAIELEDIDIEKVKRNLSTAENTLQTLSEGSENDAARAEAEITAGVCRELLASLNSA